MKNRKLINRIAAVGGATCLALAVLASPTTTISVYAAAPNTAETQHEIIEWRWKGVDGIIYRRLYNYSINAWVGEWEYVGPYLP